LIPPKQELTICFAHVAYQFQGLFERRHTGIKSFQVWNRADLDDRLGEADVLVISGLWKNDLIERGKKLRYVQSIGAGTDQFSRELLMARGIRLASARGVNARAVSEHAMALMLALTRRLPEARDNQAKRVWRDMIGDPAVREDELGGKTVIVVGTGAIGGYFVRLAKAFDMRVIGVRRDSGRGKGDADSVHATAELKTLLPEADFVVLTCPLTKETEGLIDGDALGRMKRSAYLVNVARGRCVDEPALQDALLQGRIAGAALDVTVEEPLAPASPLWAMENVLITPHTAGETRRYEENVLDILLGNLDRLWRGETALRNQVL